MNLFSLVHQFNNVNSDNHAVIQETSVNSDIVMVTNSFNSTTSKGSFSSTSPMKLQLASDKLILLCEENKNDDFEVSDELATHLDVTCQLSKIHNLQKLEEYRTVKLVKEKSVGFGLNIKGGCEHGLPILISGLTKDGPADRSRQLFIGDAIVRIDDSVLTLTHTTHEEAIRLLKQAGVEVSLTVKHFKMVSPFLKKCWRKKQTLDEAGDLMVTSNNNVDLMVDEKLLTKKEIICDSKFKSGPGRLEPQSCEGKIKKSKALSSKAVSSSEKQPNVKNWIPHISIDLATCFVTKYVHDSDKIRPHGFEIRWLTAVDSQSKTIKSYPSTALSSSSSGSASSSTSSTTSLSTPKSVDSGVGVGIKCASNSTITSVENCKEPLVVTKAYSSAIVICDNQEIYRKWFFNIDKSVKTVIHNRVKLLNSYLPESKKIHFMGWISQGLPTTSSEPYRPCYHWYTRYLVLKGGDGLIYKKPPNGLLCHPANDNSSSPCIRWSEGEPYLFKAHQSILRSLKSNEYVDERENCFLLLSCDTSYSTLSSASSTAAMKKTTAPLSSNKISTNTTLQTTRNETKKSDTSSLNTNKSDSTTVFYLSVETSSELALIRNNWNRATYQSVTQLGSKTFPVTCSGKMGNLVLDWRLGFMFRYPNERQYDWSYKFSQLKTSSDDGQTILWLSFRIHSQSSSTTSSSTTSSHSEINYRSSGRLNVYQNDSINTESPSTGSSETLHSSLPSITKAPTDKGKGGKAGSTSSTGSFSSPSQGESIENKLTIETREIHTNQLQNLLYCIHAFLTAKVISVDQSFLQNC